MKCRVCGYGTRAVVTDLPYGCIKEYKRTAFRNPLLYISACFYDLTIRKGGGENG
jgi:hypothetical protein